MNILNLSNRFIKHTNRLINSKNTSVTALSLAVAVALSLSALALPITVQAQNDNLVHVCVAEDGTPTYTNNIAGLKGCKPLTGVFVTTVSAFKSPSVAATSTSKKNTSSKNNNSNSNNNNNINNNDVNSNNSSNRSNAEPADFPRENASSQRQRDEIGRRPILERELREREERCAATGRELSGNPPRFPGESDTSFGQRIAAMRNQIERCNADLTAIRRELNALK